MKFPFRGNGISEKDFEKLKQSGVIKEEMGPNKIITLRIPKEECVKIPGAEVIGQGELELCVIPIRDNEGKVEIKKLEIVE